ncbi:hypothetical protein [Streptomyces acidiscabies]|uniref:hypothetical protein n=1 Tax=Streptomyces acidiscabies TaxID=42234 RepID=UPI000952AED8|nr:hypothetical protein [Streptomyces acidiscabies]
MTSLHIILNQTGRRYDGLAKQLTAIGDEVLPLVETVTGLPLPDPVVIRLVSPRTWLWRNRRCERRQYYAEIRELPVTRDDMRAAIHTIRTEQRSRKQNWFVIGAQTAEFTTGQPEIAVIPDALRESGWLTDRRSLYRTVAHECTHLAQHRASGHLWAAMRSPFPRARGIENLAHRSLIEGHAYWADRQITEKLLGAPEDNNEITPPERASLRFREIAATPEYDAAKTSLAEAQHAVTNAIDAIGCRRFNQVWTDTSRIPAHTDITDPDTWARRLAAAPGTRGKTT